MRDFTECGTHIKKSLPQPTDAIVKAEQVRLLYGSRAILLINLVNAPIAAVLLWRIYPAWIMLGWASLFFIVIAARILLWRRFQRQQPAIQAAEHWGPGFALGAIVTGCLWGLLGSVVFMTQNLAYYVFVVFLLGGMTAGAAMRESAYLPAFYGFATPAVLPMIVALLTKGGYTMGAMGLLLTSFAVMLLLMGRENNRWITGSIRLRIEQATLNDDLQRMASDLERDVSERTQAEIALQEREAELREAQRVAHVGDWGWLPEANKTEWSEELYRIFGRDPGLPAPSVQEHAHFMTSESFARMKTAIAACRDTGAPYEIDLELVRPDGAAAWISARGEAQRDADGRITRIRGTAQDITARTHAEQNIAKLHEKMAEHVNALRRHEQDMTAIAKLSDILQSCHSTAEAYPIIVTTASNLFRETNGAMAVNAGETQ
jgi:PAS domain S-box-containing protein